MNDNICFICGVKTSMRLNGVFKCFTHAASEMYESEKYHKPCITCRVMTRLDEKDKCDQCKTNASELTYMEIFEASLKGGDVHTLDKIKTKTSHYEEIKSKLGHSACKIAAENGSIESIQWLNENGWQPCMYAFHEAIKTEHDYLVKWMITSGVYTCYVNDDSLEIMATKGRLDLLKWVKEKMNLTIDSVVGDAAIKAKQVDTLNWLISDCGYTFTSRSMLKAVEGGHLDTVKALREGGCEWDSWSCAHAARDGHLSILQYLRENGCPWDETTCDYAMRSGHFGILSWAVKNGCPY